MSDEYKVMEKFMEERGKIPDRGVIDLGAIDLCYDIQNYLNAKYEMLAALKVPKKSKRK